jgi:cytochrome c2
MRVYHIVNVSNPHILIEWNQGDVMRRSGAVWPSGKRRGRGFPSRQRIALAALLMTVLCSAAGCAYQATASNQPLHGDKLFDRRCGDCHDIDADSIGPRLQGVVGRRAGTVPGYHYSKALAQAAVVWTPAMLDAWLSDPEKVIPGQRMRFHLADSGERQEVIAYLQQHGG